jgi:hypothetical protein
MGQEQSKRNPSVRQNVPGAPFLISDKVTVCRLADETANSSYLFRRGVVEYFNYSCGCGQTYPGDPMIGVRFANGETEEFWREELKTAKAPGRRTLRSSRRRRIRRTRGATIPEEIRFGRIQKRTERGSRSKGLHQRPY